MGLWGDGGSISLAGFIDAVKTHPGESPGRAQGGDPRNKTQGVAQNKVKKVESKKMVHLHVKVPDSHDEKTPCQQVHPMAQPPAAQSLRCHKSIHLAQKKERQFQNAEPMGH